MKDFIKETCVSYSSSSFEPKQELIDLRVPSRNSIPSGSEWIRHFVQRQRKCSHTLGYYGLCSKKSTWPAGFVRSGVGQNLRGSQKIGEKLTLSSLNNLVVASTAALAPCPLQSQSSFGSRSVASSPCRHVLSGLACSCPTVLLDQVPVDGILPRSTAPAPYMNCRRESSTRPGRRCSFEHPPVLTRPLVLSITCPVFCRSYRMRMCSQQLSLQCASSRRDSHIWAAFASAVPSQAGIFSYSHTTAPIFILQASLPRHALRIFESLRINKIILFSLQLQCFEYIH